ncbi:unannotated protein [freshwater metagenome]|uniref:Unannotated protein n=1 Tax=freshwater metagenome TaxID=449393 RepID=A0A6J7P9U3_9ZZZZ
MPVSRRASRTNATSNTSRGSAASEPRISMIACPRVSSARTICAVPKAAPTTLSCACSSNGGSTSTRPPPAIKRKVSLSVRRRSSAILRGSWPEASSAALQTRTPAVSSDATASNTAKRCANGEPPNALRTCSAVTRPSECARAWSSSESASRALPAAARATISRASSSYSTASKSRICARCAERSWTESRENSKCWVRDRIVGSTFCGSVVASTKTTWSGGSSRVLRSVLDASVVSMCTSSRMYTLRDEPAPRPRLMRETKSRASCTPRFDAASSSIKSVNVPALIPVQLIHASHGSPSAPRSRQLRAFARIRALVVLPVPRGPESK